MKRNFIREVEEIMRADPKPFVARYKKLHENRVRIAEGGVPNVEPEPQGPKKTGRRIISKGVID